MQGSLRRLLVAGMVLLGVAVGARGAAPLVPDPDVALLKKLGIATDTRALLTFLRERTPEDGDLSRIGKLIEQLGDDEFDKREDASDRLVRLGGRAEAALKKALTNRDLEVRKRANECLEKIPKRTPADSISATIRLLRRRDSVEAAAALLAYLPMADDHEQEEIYYALLDFSEKHVPKALEVALADRAWQRRAAAACVIGRNGDEKQRTKVKSLLKDAEVEVRLRAAQGLLAAQDASGLAPLTDLLEGTTLPIAWQAEELLRYAAGLDSPREVVGKGDDQARKACRAAWAAWLRKSGKVDLVRGLRFHRRPALVLALEQVPQPPATKDARKEEDDRRGVRLWLCGGDGQPRCEAFDSVAQAVRTFPQANDRGLAISGRVDLWWFNKLGLLQGREASDEYCKFFTRGNNPRELADEHRKVAHVGPDNQLVVLTKEYAAKVEGRDPVAHRLSEFDSIGRLVWEALFEQPTGAVVILPLVRVGFPARGVGMVNLASVRARADAMQSRDDLCRVFAAATLRSMTETPSYVSRHKDASLRWPEEERAREKKEPAFYVAAERGLTDPLPQVRASAAAMLIDGGANTPGRIRLLMPLLNDKRTCEVAAKALATNGEAGIRALIAVVEDRDGPGKRVRRPAAVFALAESVGQHDRLIATTLKAAVRDPDREVRLAVAQALCRNRRRSAPFMAERVHLISDPDEQVAGWAIMDLGEVGPASKHAIPTLIKTLERKNLRSRALRAVGEVGRWEEKALKWLLELAEQTKDVRDCADLAAALGYATTAENAKRTLPVLKRYLKDERYCEAASTTVQSATIFALRQIGKPARPLIADLVALWDQTRNQWPTTAQYVTWAIEEIDPTTASRLGK